MGRCRTLALCLVLAVAGVGAQEPPPLVGNSSISGRVVVADTGAPLSGAAVLLTPTIFNASATRSTISGAGGEFAFGGIPAGSYRIIIRKAGFREPEEGIAPRGLQVSVGQRRVLDDVSVRLDRSAVVAGRVVDEFGDPVDRVTVNVMRLQYGPDGKRSAASAGIPDFTDDHGRFRVFGLAPGDYFVVASVRSHARDLLRPYMVTAAEDLAPTYYPGTANAGDAQMVSLGPGEEAAIEMTLQRVRAVTVSGVATTSTGRPAAGMRVMLKDGSGGSFTRYAGVVASSGAFSIPHVVTGTYFIEISAGPGSGVGESGSVTVSVDERDLTGVSIVTRAGATLRGVVVFEGAFRPGSFQIGARSIEATHSSRLSPVSDLIGSDGRFELRGVPDRVFLEPVNSMWMIQSVTIDGRTLDEEPLALTDGQVMSGFRVTVTDRLTNLSGTAADDRGRPLPDRTVVVMRLDAPSLLPGVRVRYLRTDERGRFQTRGLKPGSYVAGVFEYLEPGHDYSPEFEEGLRARGRRFMLGGSETLTLDLTATSGV